MKKRITLFLLLLFISVSLFAGDWIKLPGGGIVDVAVAENGCVAICDKSGVLYVSKNAGVSWDQIPKVGGVIRISISSDASVMGIVDKSGKFYVTRDMGSSWVTSEAGGVVDSSVGKSHVFITDKAGDVYYSTDYKKWTKTNAADAKICIFGGAFLFISSKNGDTFTADFKNSPLMAYKKTAAGGVVDIDIAPNGNLWIADKLGELYFSADKGATWKKEAGVGGIVAVSLCNKYTVIADKSGIAYIKEN